MATVIFRCTSRFAERKQPAPYIVPRVTRSSVWFSDSERPTDPEAVDSPRAPVSPVPVVVACKLGGKSIEI